MHINMKYYVVTIGAIFIAIGIGILVGFNLNYDQELSKQQASVINDLDERFESLKNTNDTLEKQVSQLEENYNKSIEFINDNSDKIIANALTEKNIGIISTNENNDYTNEIKDIIINANGNVSFEIVLKDSIKNEDKLQEMSTKLGVDIKNTEGAIQYILESLKSEDASEKLTYLQELGMIKLNSLGDSYLSYESVVITGGSSDKDLEGKYSNIDDMLISKLKDENKYIVGVQKSDTKYSYINDYKDNKIATVDNINEAIGNISLVLLLQEGNSIGSYGRLDTAESLVPYKK